MSTDKGVKQMIGIVHMTCMANYAVNKLKRQDYLIKVTEPFFIVPVTWPDKPI
jgi:hypothetical protein